MTTSTARAWNRATVLKTPSRDRAARILISAGLTGALLAGAGPATAATQVVVSTPYPAVAVEPGATASFTLTVTADTRERVDLALRGVPEGWTATLRGGGFVVDGVFSDPAEPPEVTLAVEVPADAAQGEYRMTVTGTATGASNTLILDLRVAETAAGSLSLSSNFPELQGPSDSTFNFDLTLENETPEEIAANLSATLGVADPQGWQIEARPSGQEQAATATVSAGGTSGITVSVDPPNDVPAGEYPILVQATGGTRTAEAQLLVRITGNFAMTLTTPEDRLNATVQAGAPRDVQLVVVNDGTAPLVGVQVTGTGPTGWTISQPAPIAEIAPGDEANVTLSVQPAAEAVAGDYVVTFTADAAETSANVDIRTTVETSLTWAVVGALLIVGTLLALGWVFQRYGRR
jgi:uncharacterized membrane protein